MCHSAWPVTAVVGQGPPVPPGMNELPIGSVSVKQHTTCRASSTQLNSTVEIGAPTTTTTQRSGKKKIKIKK